MKFASCILLAGALLAGAAQAADSRLPEQPIINHPVVFPTEPAKPLSQDGGFGHNNMMPVTYAGDASGASHQINCDVCTGHDGGVGWHPG